MSDGRIALPTYLELLGKTPYRLLSFYSHAKHAEMDRSVLALSTSLALVLLPLVGLFKRTHKESFAG